MEASAELQAFLSSIPIFGALEDSTLARIVPMLRLEEHPQGSVIVREGDPGFCMYVVRAGEVSLNQQGCGPTPTRIVRLGPGECFGEMAILDIQARSATVVAEQPSILYSLTNRDLYALYTSDMPGYVMLIQNLCRELSRRLRRANARITELAGESRDETTQIRPLKLK